MLIGSKIKTIRTDLGLEAQAVAQAAGLTSSTISDVEKDKRSPTLDTLEKICKAMGCSVIEVLPVEEHMDGRYSLTNDEMEVIEFLHKLKREERKHFLLLFKSLLKTRKK